VPANNPVEGPCAAFASWLEQRGFCSGMKERDPCSPMNTGVRGGKDALDACNLTAGAHALNAYCMG
jgi:hypothetical protein